MNSLIYMILFLLALVGSSTDYKNYTNNGMSMLPTIHNGDKLRVKTDISAGIKIEDLIILKTDERSYCKRVIGTEGDQVEIKPKGIYVNGKLAYKAKNQDFLVKPKITLKSNEFYVLGDNLDESMDSRFYGPIMKDQILGKVTKITHKE